jgi:hypothetical protein
MLNIKRKKHYFLLNFIFIFIKHKYLCFMKDKYLKTFIKDYNNFNYIKIKSSLIKKLFLKNNFFNFLKNNFFIIYFNDFEIFNRLLKINNEILALSSSMFLVNNNYIKNINNYYLYYKNNYYLYKKIIFLFFRKYYFFIFFILRNLLILLKIKKTKKIKTI